MSVSPGQRSPAAWETNESVITRNMTASKWTGKERERARGEGKKQNQKAKEAGEGEETNHLRRPSV